MKKTIFFRISFLACSALAAILQLLAVIFSHDRGTHYFEAGAILPILATVFAAAGAALGIIAARMTVPEDLNDSPFPRRPLPSPLTLGFVAIAAVLVLFGVSTLTTVAALLMLCSAIYEILVGIPQMRRGSASVYPGLLCVIGLILLNAVYYFDVTVEMNSPYKVTVQIALLFAMLAKTSEIRFLLGTAHPRMHLALSACAVAIGALPALSIPAAYLLGKTNRIDYAAGGLLILCTVLTSLLRIKTLLSKQPASSDTDNADGADTAAEENRKDPT